MSDIAKGKGDCYVVHAEAVIGDRQDFTLVHGMVSGQMELEGLRYGHCWLEKHGWVFDFSNDSFFVMPVKTYYRVGEIKNEPGQLHKYSSEEADEMMSIHETYGPWELDGIL
jgi:hypothetical protein